MSVSQRPHSAPQPIGIAGNRSTQCCVVAIGAWPGISPGSEDTGEDIRIIRTYEHDVRLLVRRKRANWLLIGEELDDGDIQRVVLSANSGWKDLRLAILGLPSDWRRCERWVRRGCRVYLDATASPHRVRAAIRAAHTLEITVVDRVFFHTRSDRALGPTPHLTMRERDVLNLISRGLRNREVAQELYVSENTVEYHMRHLLEKFNSRNRLEMVERAMSLGLV